MDLIYANEEMEDIGVLKGYKLDIAFGSDENNLACEVDSQNDVCKEKYFLYVEGTEYGGIIDKIASGTLYNKITYKGRTWHGILDSKILQPDTGADYLTVSGEANTVLLELIVRMELDTLFKVSESDSGIVIQNYKINRYISGYAGILKMLKANGGKLNISFKRGFVELSAIPFVDYSKDEQFDTDQISFTIERRTNHVNHVICLGRGDLKDRRVIHLYVDSVGNVSGKQTLTGLDEVCSVYDNSNAESDDELINGGLDIIKQSWAENSIEFSFDSNDASFDVNDVIGAKELTTGLMVSSSIAKKIVKIEDNATSISYECEGNTGSVASSGYPASGGGGGTTVTVKVNSTKTGLSGTEASVTNVGDDVNVKLDFVIPRGEKGEKGDTGAQGPKGERGDTGNADTVDGHHMNQDVLTTSAPTFNRVYTPNWFRSTGNSGWYNETYGGGWFMQDTSWIRAHGNKSVYTGGEMQAGIIRGINGIIAGGNGILFGMQAGTTVGNPNGGSSLGIIARATGNAWAGHDIENRSILLVANGDGNAASHHVEGGTYQSDVWYAVFNANKTGNIRVNWVFIWW